MSNFLRIINLFEENSTGAKTLSHRKLASLATVDLERIVTHTTIRKILRQKDELKKSQTLRKKDVRVRDDSLIEFEKALKVVFDETSKRAELNLDSAREIAKELASSEKFSPCNFGQVEFGRKWLRNFFRRYGFAHGRKQGSRCFMPKNEIDAEVARIKESFSGYEDCNIWF